MQRVRALPVGEPHHLIEKVHERDPSTPGGAAQPDTNAVAVLNMMFLLRAKKSKVLASRRC